MIILMEVKVSPLYQFVKIKSKKEHTYIYTYKI